MHEKFANKIKEQNKKMAEVLGSSGIEVRPSKVTTFDFLALKKNDKISKLLNTKKEVNSAVIYSDYIYILREDNLAHKSKRILYITEYSIYLLHHSTFKIQRIIPITDLKMLIIVKSSGTLVAFHFEKEYCWKRSRGIEETYCSRYTGGWSWRCSWCSCSSGKG